MNKKSNNQYVTNISLRNELNITENTLRSEISETGSRLNKKIDGVALHVINLEGRIERIENNMATKSDVNLILDRIDHLTKKVDVYDKKAVVHDYRLNEIESKINKHDQRLSLLESR